jgi:hypothetical protein
MKDPFRQSSLTVGNVAALFAADICAAGRISDLQNIQATFVEGYRIDGFRWVAQIMLASMCSEGRACA